MAPISGGAPKKRGRGAPKGNLNALKTGRYTARSRAIRKRSWDFTSGVLAFVRHIEALYGIRARRFKSRKQLWPVLPDEARRKLREKPRA